VIEALSVGTPVAVASGSALDEITPPHSPRFSPTDGPALSALMIGLADAPTEDPEALRTWAAGYGTAAYQERFNHLIEELK